MTHGRRTKWKKINPRRSPIPLTFPVHNAYTLNTPPKKRALTSHRLSPSLFYSIHYFSNLDTISKSDNLPTHALHLMNPKFT